MKNLVISFSGGETSALMTDLLLREARDEYGAICVVFANTGQERDETLDFVRDCDEHFGFGTVWLEAVVHHNATRANTHRIVTYETAARLGGHGPFHDAIRKYGIPNQKFPGCTRDLKQNPIKSYVEGELGWTDYDLAIGIRIDEIDRMRNRSEVIYPLVSRWPHTKPQVNTWWDAQPFRLRLKGYEGNCAWCWKKSKRKHLTLLREAPDLYDFPREMERTYAHHGPEFRKTELYDPEKHTSKRGKLLKPLPDGYRRTFFRGNLSVEDLEAEAAALPASWQPAYDDHIIYDPEYDVGAGCEESCEVFSDDVE